MMRARLTSAFLLVALAVGLLLGAAPAVAQESELSVSDVVTTEYPTISFKVGLPPLLTTGTDQPTFSVTENGSRTSGVKAVPLTGPAAAANVVLVMDMSGSMAGKPLDDAKAAARKFVDSLGPDARVAVLGFSDSPELVTGFTSARGELNPAIASLRAKGETALYDALVRAAQLLPVTATGQRSIVLLSDGGDTVSSGTLDTAREAVLKTGAPVYVVALKSKESNFSALTTLASSTGGRLVSAAGSASLSGLFESIASEIRNAWRVTYTSNEPKTKDLEIAITANAAGETKSATVAVANPLFDMSGRRSVGELTVRQVAESPALAAAIGALLFLSVALLAGATLLMLVRGKANLGQLEYYDQLHAEAAVGPETGGVADQVRSRVVEAVGQVAGKRGMTQLVTHQLEAAGLPLRAAEYITLHVSFVALAAAVVQLLTNNVPMSLIVVLFVTVGPIIGLGMAVSSRRARFEEQLPDILSMISGSLRGGWGIQQALNLVVQQAAPPAAPEFRRVDAETRLGMPLEQSLQRMADRIGSADFQAAVTAISIQREVGGNLAAVLDVVALTIRERAALRRHVSSLTAESRLSAYILIGLPFLILGVLLVVQPTYIIPLFTSSAGFVVGGIGILLLVIGIIWISRVSKVEV